MHVLVCVKWIIIHWLLLHSTRIGDVMWGWGLHGDEDPVLFFLMGHEKSTN